MLSSAVMSLSVTVPVPWMLTAPFTTIFSLGLMVMLCPLITAVPLEGGSMMIDGVVST